MDTLVRLIALLEQASGESLRISRAQLQAVGYELQLALLTDAMKRAGLLARTGNVEVVRGIVQVFSKNLNTSYAPAGRYSGCALLFNAADPAPMPEGCEEDEIEEAGPVQHWADYVTEIELIELPGNHMTLLKQPNIDAIARHLQRHWRTCDGDDAAHSAPRVGGISAEQRASAPHRAVP